MITRRSAIGIALAALLIGAGCTGLVGRANADRELRSLSLNYELEAAGLCAGGLKLYGAQRGDTLVTLLEMRLESAVGSAASLVDDGARLLSDSASLRDTARRAAEYYSSKNDAAKQQSAEALHARLLKDR